MAQVLNLQETAANIYQTILDLNKSATQMIGLDAIWCRLLPYDNGEDVIVQEYTLHQYECPKNIKVVSNNSNFNVGNFTIDLFGIKQAESLEIGIDVETWKAVYGENTMPQKGDFILIQLLHRPYEVVSSTPVHTIGQKITSWKCMLGEWKHAASRAESEDFKISIDELTNGQDRLFGDTISKEVADAVNDVETAYNTTTYVDPFKDFDMNSIIVEDVFGRDRNLISAAYYAFEKANKPIVYKVDAVYDTAVKENTWIYSCWFKGNSKSNSYGVKIELQTKDSDYWYFNINAKTKLEYGQKVSLVRGTQIILNGEVDTDGCDNKWVIKVSTSECLSNNKKFPKFWETGIWKLKIKTEYNLLTLKNNGNIIVKFNITTDNCIVIKFNDIQKIINIKNLKLELWNYIAFEITPKNIRIIILDIITDKDGHTHDNTIMDEKIPINIKTFSIDSAALNNARLEFNMTNIRLFENEYEFGDAYKQDMYSQVVRNASKLILVDTPKPANDMSFVSPIR